MVGTVTLSSIPFLLNASFHATDQDKKEPLGTAGPEK